MNIHFTDKVRTFLRGEDISAGSTGKFRIGFRLS